MRRIASTLLLTLLACSGGAPSNGQSEDKVPPMTPTQPTPKTTLEQAKQQFPQARVVQSEISVPGVELFELRSDGNVPADANSAPPVVAIAGGVGKPILEGRDAMRAVINATKDPTILARAAMAIEKQDAELLTAPKNDEQKRANVGPPAIAGNTLTFWMWTRGVGRMLQLGEVDLTTGAFKRGAPQVSSNEKIEKAVEALAGTSVSMQSHAIQTLAAACSTDAKARAALLDAIAHHQREETRIAAVEASPACGAAAVDTLIHALEHDAARLVRGKAALALGDIGDRKAIPALEKAASTDIASAAKVALGKLK